MHLNGGGGSAGMCCTFTIDTEWKVDLFMEIFEEIPIGMVEAVRNGLAKPWWLSLLLGDKYYKYIEVVFKIGVSLLSHEDNCNMHNTYIYTHVYIWERSHSSAVIVTNVGFNNVHDNNLDSEVLYYTAGFILCGKAGSST